ncbi:ATP-grasp domain-containing protein [Candidatus Nomurabacteria bacterium]|nr:ATP-grasp domain-containing protein [Candidatus Nomurabacteria bacterium]MCB9819236.1 ATP-grasp domain-containing protein [Candidatus Nomurabacteria bacterium]
MAKKKKNIIAYVSKIPSEAISDIRAYEKQTGERYRIMLIENSARNLKKGQTGASFDGVDIVLSVDFGSDSALQEALAPYQEELCAITSRAESYLNDFIKIIPFVPYLYTPTPESLQWASDKRLMRRHFKVYDSAITPKYTLVKNAEDEELDRIINQVGLPMIVKPTNLAQSLLIHVCHHKEELRQTVKYVLKSIEKTYEEYGRTERPRIIAEQYLEGLQYSIDAYVSARGKVTCCPLVRQKTGHDIGRDDFFGYLQSTPTALSSESVKRAENVAKDGVHALGLRNTTVHVELMRVDNDWKIIEIGARIGGFRSQLHRLSCGINHGMNDVLVRMGKQPVVPRRCRRFAAAMKYYAKEEGEIVSILGVKKIEKLASFHKIEMRKKRGDKSIFAKNGGGAVFVLYLVNDLRSELLADIRRVEATVKVKVIKV